MGVSPEITKRAAQVTDLVSRFEIVELLDVEMSAEEAQELEQAEMVARRFLEWDLDADEQRASERESVARSLARIIGSDE
jgi:DNA mismatch repair protein MSH5